MDIFSVFTLLGGLAFFLYGMNVMSMGLEKMAGGKLERMLKRMTSSPLKSMALGMGITIAIQSSSAMTVMLVGLVNSGIMQLGQTIGVIMGSNVGTTLTAWLLSLAGIESSNILIKMFKPDSFSPLVAFIGIMLIMISKNERKKDIGNVMIGFSALMFGMELMSDAVVPLADMPQFTHLLTAFTHPLLGVIVGAVFTGIIQSSAASVGILQALSLTGSITYGMSIPIIMGQNIGTCVTALLSSIGVNKNAKRVAAVHISFNLIGTAVWFVVFFSMNKFLHFDFVEKAINPVGIALVHSVFNIGTTLVLFPFAKWIEKLAVLVVKNTNDGEDYALIDERLLNSPSVAISECRNLTVQMAKLSRYTILSALDLIWKYDEKKANEIEESESKIDLFEDTLGTFLVKLSSKQLSGSDSKEISILLHTIGDFERIGDHAVNLLRVAKEVHEKEVKFSDEAVEEISVITSAIVEILSTTIDSFVDKDQLLATQVEPLEQVIDNLIAKTKTKHIERLQNGNCTIMHGFVLSDMLNNFERVSDHCSNIAVCLISVSDNSFDTHKYLSNVKTHGDDSFDEMYRKYAEKYSI